MTAASAPTTTTSGSVSESERTAFTEIPNRIEALELAAEASAETARATAFRLADDDDPELRSAASSVLVGTADAEGDEERLDRLIESENVASIEDKLRRARRAISMSTVDDALERLVSILDLGSKVDDVPDSSVLLPDDDWHEAFINDVNDLRRANYESDSPRNFINVACSLTELMAKQALLARYDFAPKATSLNDTTAEHLRTNTRHIKLGTLLKNDLNLKTFPWFSPLLSLAYYRNVHGARIGNTSPPKLGPEEYSEVLVYLRQVFLGWVKSMYETRSLGGS